MSNLLYGLIKKHVDTHSLFYFIVLEVFYLWVDFLLHLLLLILILLYYKILFKYLLIFLSKLLNELNNLFLMLVMIINFIYFMNFRSIFLLNVKIGNSIIKLWLFTKSNTSIMTWPFLRSLWYNAYHELKFDTLIEIYKYWCVCILTYILTDW